MIDETLNSHPVFNLRTCTQKAWTIVLEHWLSLGAAAFVCQFLGILSACLVFAVLIDWPGWNLLVACVVGILVGAALQCGYLRLCLKLADTNNIFWSELFSGWGGCLQLSVATFFYCYATLLFLCMLIVPGFMIFGQLSLFGLVIVDKRLGAFQAAKESQRMVKGSTWLALGILFIFFAGEAFLGLWSTAFQCLLVMSQCLLYRHLCSREISS
jgi:hypothetical protein